MTFINRFILKAAGISALLFACACSSQDDFDEIITDNTPRTCRMTLHGSLRHYDEGAPTRSVGVWENGDKIYLTFTTAEGTAAGDAIYNNGEWTVNYYGSLIEGTATSCKAYYFDNPDFQSSTVVNITESTGIYEAATATYIFQGGELSVTADLTPKTGRIRFAGTDGDEITLYGISHYTSYDCATGKFTQSSGALSKTVASGYTPYVYGEFSDTAQPRLNLITSDAAFTRLPSTSIYTPGESGYMAIPSEASHNGWLNSLVMKVNGVEFTMIQVVKEGGNFLLAETETTEELYAAVTEGTSTTSRLACGGVSWNKWNSFLSKLSTITELPFRMPSRAEWQYAAKGGDKSQGYVYSGSNILSEVGWYTGNSGNARHEVKQLQPNELGFYDMSGNVMEATSDLYGGYSYYYCGGYYGSPANQCENSWTYTADNDYNYAYFGLRIALSNK